MIAGIDRILDMFRTTVNILGNASASVAVAATEDELWVDDPEEVQPS